MAVAVGEDVAAGMERDQGSGMTAGPSAAYARRRMAIGTRDLEHWSRGQLRAQPGLPQEAGPLMLRDMDASLESADQGRSDSSAADRLAATLRDGERC
jgi:hypothetical protein